MAENKEALSISDIESELRNIRDNKGREDKKGQIEYLKGFLTDENYKDKKRELVKLIHPLITNKSDAVEYRLIYDSLNEGLEPIYYWLLDYMSDSSPGGLGLEVRKGDEWMNVSASSGYFGEIGQRATLMQQKAMEYLGAVNAVIKSILNLIYDLREFKIRIESYDDANSEEDNKKDMAIKSLKGIWMDQVDARKGRASINLLTQDLQFVTLRDAFFYINNKEEVDRLDLNDRVKNILKRKLEEYNRWHSNSEIEIRKRYEIERAYLKSQVGTLQLYSNWIKPYLLAAQKLKIQKMDAKSLTNPSVVNAFSNMEMEIKLYGKKEVKPENVHDSLRDIQLDKKYYAIVEVTTNFRSVPSALSGPGGRQYVHGGRTTVIIRGFVLDDTELNALESHELYEDLDLIENYVNISMSQLKKEVDEFLNPSPKEERKPEKPKFENPFSGVLKGFKEILQPLGIQMPKKKVSSVIYNDVENTARETSKNLSFRIYNIYKKTHGMANI